MVNDYPDTNGNGVPDAFENRLPLTEMLNMECGKGSVIVEVDLEPRPPKRGEWYFAPGGSINLSPIDFGDKYVSSPFRALIIKRVIAGTLKENR